MPAPAGQSARCGGPRARRPRPPVCAAAARLAAYPGEEEDGPAQAEHVGVECRCGVAAAYCGRHGEFTPAVDDAEVYDCLRDNIDRGYRAGLRVCYNKPTGE